MIGDGKDSRGQRPLEAAYFAAYEWDAATGSVRALLPDGAEAALTTLDDVIERRHADDRARLRAAIEGALGGCGRFECETRMTDGAGGLRWIHDRGQVRFDEAGQPLGFLAVAVDVTERRRLEELETGKNRVLEHLAGGAGLREVLVELIRMIESQAGDALCTIDLERSERARAGAPFAAPRPPRGGRLPLEPRPLLRTVVTSVEGADQWHLVARKRGLSTCWSSPVVGAGGDVLATFSMYFRESTRPTPRDRELIGVATHLAAIAIERQLAEQALRESEQQSRALFEYSPVGILVIDPEDLRVVHFNEQAHRMLAYGREEFARLVITDIDIGDPDEVRAFTRRCTVGGYRHYETRWRTRVGDVLSIHAVDTAVRIAGHRYQLSYAVDVTARRRAEEDLRELNQRLEELVSQANEPVHRANQLQMLASKLSAAEQEERRRIAHTLHDHLQQILVAAKVALGQVRAIAENPTPVDNANELIDTAIEASRSLAVELCPPVLYDRGLAPALGWLGTNFRERHNLTVRVHAEETAEPANQELQTFLFHAVRELLFNVVKHAQSTTAWVRMQEDDDCVRIEVRDLGVGWDVERARAERGDACFGLFNIQQRIELLGGTFEVDSTIGEGSRITLRVPRGHLPSAALDGEPVLEAPARATRPREPDVPDGHRIQVLLVDDHEILREGLAGLLEAETDLELVGQAGDGVEALELCRALEPQVVLMDISMPRMDGIEATRRLKSELPHVRVIGLSMYSGSEMTRAMLAAGADAYVSKGGAPAELLAAIRTHGRG